jgi:hypothetical protein
MHPTVLFNVSRRIVIDVPFLKISSWFLRFKLFSSDWFELVPGIGLLLLQRPASEVASSTVPSKKGTSPPDLGLARSLDRVPLARLGGVCPT